MSIQSSRGRFKLNSFSEHVADSKSSHQIYLDFKNLSKFFTFEIKKKKSLATGYKHGSCPVDINWRLPAMLKMAGSPLLPCRGGIFIISPPPPSQHLSEFALCWS